MHAYIHTYIHACMHACMHTYILTYIYIHRPRQTLLSAAAAPSSISHQFPQVFRSSRVSEVTLGTFSVRFCGLFVLPCLAVLVPGGAFGTPVSAAAAAAATPAAV